MYPLQVMQYILGTGPRVWAGQETVSRLCPTFPSPGQGGIRGILVASGLSEKIRTGVDRHGRWGTGLVCWEVTSLGQQFTLQGTTFLLFWLVSYFLSGQFHLYFCKPHGYLATDSSVGAEVGKAGGEGGVGEPSDNTGPHQGP